MLLIECTCGPASARCPGVPRVGVEYEVDKGRLRIKGWAIRIAVLLLGLAA